MTNEVQKSEVPAIIKDFTNIAALQEWAKAMVGASLVPFNKPEDLIVAASWAHENRFPVVNSLPYLFVVNGKLAVATKIQRALIQRANVKVETVEDYRPIYQYKGKNELLVNQDELDEKERMFEVFQSVEAFKAFQAAGHIDKETGITKAGKVAVVRGVKPIDYRTKVKLTRMLPSANGIKEVSEVGTFLWTDAIRAELTEKDNWLKYPKAMLYARAFGIVVDRLCADLLMGAVSVYELDDAPNIAPDVITEDTEYEEVE